MVIDFFGESEQERDMRQMLYIPRIGLLFSHHSRISLAERLLIVICTARISSSNRIDINCRVIETHQTIFRNSIIVKLFDSVVYRLHLLHHCYRL